MSRAPWLVPCSSLGPCFVPLRRSWNWSLHSMSMSRGKPRFGSTQVPGRLSLMRRRRSPHVRRTRHSREATTQIHCQTPAVRPNGTVLKQPALSAG